MSNRLKDYAKAVAAVALGRVPAGRNATVFPDDVFLVSYLRSGSTWSRFLFGNLVYPDQPVTFANVDQMVPTIYAFPDRILRKLPRLLKSHECFDPRYPRVIYIVRDPRDVAVSLYFFNLKQRNLPDGYPIEDFIPRFLAAKTVGYADRLGSWEDHVLSWVRMRQGNPNFALLRYEDLLADPVKELRRAVSLLRIDAPSERIAGAIELSSAQNMRSLEQQQWKSWVTTKDSRSDIPFIREAKAGGWRNKLPQTSVSAIENAWGPTIEMLGYELATKPAGAAAHIG